VLNSPIAIGRAFRRVVMEEADVKEVAQELEVSVNVVYLARSRILRRLREEFADLIENSPG